MRKFVRWSILVIITIVVLAAIVYALLPQPVPVDLATAARGPMEQTVDEEGKTRIREKYVVSSPLMGRLRRITLDPGDRVEVESTVLAIIEPTDPDLLDPRALAEAEARARAAEAAVRQSDAMLDRVQVEYDFAENELSRIAELSANGGASPRELEVARTEERTKAGSLREATFAQEIARYELEVAQSALLYARGEDGANDRGQMHLRSPIDGAVLRVLQESVAVVTPGTELLEVGDPLDLELVIDVLSTDAVKIRPGQRVVIEHWGGDVPLEATVRLVEPSAFTKISALGIEEQRVNVIADLVTPADERSTLGDGFRVDAGVVVWNADDVLQVPTSATFRPDDTWAVYLVRDERVVLQPVEIGRQSGRTTQILGGLSEGDRVVMHPSDAIAPGIRVVPRDDG